MCEKCKGTGWILYKDKNGIEIARKCGCRNNGAGGDIKNEDKKG